MQRNNPIELEERMVDKANKARLPLTANFELTPTCTLRCDMCFIQMSEQRMKQLGGLCSVDSWLDIASRLRSMSTLFILLTGGEPLLYPGFDRLYAELRKMGFILTINTNGMLIDESVCELFARYKPRRVNVTLYGASADTYRRLCHNAAGFEACLRGIRLLRQHGIDTKLNFSIVRQNKDDFPEMVRMAKELDVPVISNAYMFPVLRSGCPVRDIDAQRITPEEAAWYDVQGRMLQKGDDYNDYVLSMLYAIDHYTPSGNGLCVDCRAGRSSMWISWRQRVSPCIFMEDPGVDLADTDIAQAWEQVSEATASLPPLPQCTDCKLHPLCQVCYAGSQYEVKVRGNIDYICQMTHKEYDILQNQKAAILAAHKSDNPQ